VLALPRIPRPETLKELPRANWAALSAWTACRKSKLSAANWPS
jgi:hypothetical protein